MIAEERPHHDVLVGLIAPPHHRPQRVIGRAAVDGHVERRKGQRRRIGEVARHQESAGRQQAHRETFVAAGAQIIGEQPCFGERSLFVFLGLRLQCREIRVPGRGEFCAQRFARQREAFRRPLLVALVQQRQVEQPLAGIVDDVEGQLAVRAVLPLIFDHEPQLGDVGGRTRPAPFLDQGADMVLIGEARHRVVGLRGEIGPRDPSRGIGLEHRETAAARQPMHQRGDEHGLAGARQAGDAEPHRRVEETLAIVEQRPRRETRFLDDIRETGGHGGLSEDPAGGAKRAGDYRKVAIIGPKSSFTFPAPLQVRECRGLNASRHPRYP